MKPRKITMSYAKTEPGGLVYLLRIYWESVNPKKELSHQTVHANVDSLLKFYFHDLHYRKSGDDFIPCWRQPLSLLRDDKQTFANQPVTKVEVYSTPLYT